MALTRAGRWAATALCLAGGALVGTIAPRPEGTPPTADAPPLEPEAPPRGPATPAPPDGVEAFGDPCAAVRAVQRRADALAAEIAQARARMTHRYGEPEPAPPGFDPVEAEQRYQALLEVTPDHVWSTVDCTLYPCMGLFLTDRPRNPDRLRDHLGLPGAFLVSDALFDADGAPMDLFAVGFGEAEPEGARRRWYSSIAVALRERSWPEVESFLSDPVVPD